MKKHTVKVFPAKETPPREEQLAWKLAQIAAKAPAPEAPVVEMIGNRFIDNAAVATAALNRSAPKAARLQALCHPRGGQHRGATLFGLPKEVQVSAEWAAWANGTAVRELDFHDTFLAADYSHPADNIPPLLAVAEQCGRSGADLLRALAVSYEVHVALVKAICLHEWKKDHIAHLCPAQAAGLGTLLGLSPEQTYQAIQQAVHVSFSTRQSRKGEISSWKAFAPAHAGKLAVEAIDRAMYGEKSPSPVYEGEDSVLAWMLAGKDREYEIELPEPGEQCQGILETYTKEHSAEYQAQALIDLAFDLRKEVSHLGDIEQVLIETSHHTHFVIGTGAGDPQKLDPHASRETLDHSLMYIFAVALADGEWHHERSYTPERASKAFEEGVWQKITTEQNEAWTKRYHSSDPKEKAFGGAVTITLKDGREIKGEKALANAHAYGARPFARPEYAKKLRTLTEGLAPSDEQERFLEIITRLPELPPEELTALHLVVPEAKIQGATPTHQGVF